MYFPVYVTVVKLLLLRPVQSQHITPDMVKTTKSQVQPCHMCMQHLLLPLVIQLKQV